MATKETITQLNSARDIVLRDPAIYPQVVPGVLPVITASQPVELRRWGADFLAETFASPVVSAEEKGKMCLGVLDTLKAYLNRKDELGEEEDTGVLKSAIQCAASIYPLVFRHVIAEEDQDVWAKMTNLKSAILKRLDVSSVGVRICCIKFVARMVQVQTPGLIADPRKPDQNEISLALVPREHAVLVPSTLEAEASGLLDRLLSVFQDNSTDAIVVTATLNALSTVVQRRASISTKILNTILNFNPVRNPASAVEKVATKSMTRTTITFLNNVLKRSPSHTLLGRIQVQIDRLRQMLHETFSEQQNGLKRGPDEPIDGLHPNKRIHVEAEADAGLTPQQRQPDGPLPPGPVSYKDLYTLVSDPRAAGFHVEVLPQHIVAQLVPALLQALDNDRFHQALNTVRARVLELQRRPPSSALDAGRGVLGPHLDVEEEDEEYDPNALGFGLEAQQQHDPQMAAIVQQQRVEEAMRLPPEPPLTDQELNEYGEMVRERLFDTLREVDGDVAKRKAEKKSLAGEARSNGFNKSVVTPGDGQDREGWITLLIRLATRTQPRLDEDGSEDVRIKEEGEDRSLAKKGYGGDDLPSRMRTALNRYIMDDWRRRIDVAIAWLNEEWYSEVLAAKSSTAANGSTPTSENHDNLPNYTRLSISLLDQLIPYLDIKDGRYLIRFLSEIPYLAPDMFSRIAKIAEDPERVQISTQALLYLIMLRPPVRERAIDCAVEMWRTNPDAKASAEKVLLKWRPEVVKDGGSGAPVKAEA